MRPPAAVALAPIPIAITVDDVLRELERLELLELQDVVEHMRDLLAACGLGPDIRHERLVLCILERLAPSFEELEGVPIYNVRAALPVVSRLVMDGALLAAEARGRLRLLPAKKPADTDAAAAIRRPDRGFLCYIASGKEPELPALGPASALRRRRWDMQEAGELLRELAKIEAASTELAVVRARAREIVAARTPPPDMQLDSISFLQIQRQHATGYRRAPGVPLSVLRPAFPRLPRSAFDHMVRGLEARGRLGLVPLERSAAFAEPTAGIPDADRGLLYYCATDERGTR